MSRIDSEQRSIRVSLSGYLGSHGWSGLNYSEGWDTMDIEKPLVNTYVSDRFKKNLEIGSFGATHKLFERMVQVDVFMESEARVKTLCEDVMEFMDEAAITIIDTFTTSGIGYLSFPDSESISSSFQSPNFGGVEMLRWRGMVSAQFEAYYPNGGQPF